MSEPSPDVVVIGAGISGLTCAWRLTTLGVPNVVLERRMTSGGVIETKTVDGYQIEWGPNTLLPTATVHGMIAELGLADHVISPPRRSPRYVVINGRLRKVPLGVLSARGWARVLREPFISRGVRGDETIRSFVIRRLGKEAYDRLVVPFVTGIYAGDPARLSMESTFPGLVELERRFGSLAAGALRQRRTGPHFRICSFEGGLQTLTSRLEDKVRIFKGMEVRSVDSGLRVVTDTMVFTPKAVVVTTPARAAVHILEHAYADVARHLESVEYVPMAIVALSLPEAALERPLRGFGFLVPRTERLQTLGALFSSAMFPGRAPAGHILLTAFAGGALHRDIMSWPDVRIGEQVAGEVATALRSKVKPSVIGIRRYAEAIPQFNLGHRQRIGRLRDHMQRHRGLFLTANYMDSVSLPGCMEGADQIARAVADFVRTRP